ncbi:MAG TPA: DUF190 domain-containing protein, partial [Streptosporangiaceae bacterium]|nr:DUF190 domain-containing protein [Streptosporangiaceae bacterium]
MVYTSEAAQYHGQPIHRAIIRGLRAAGISGATTQRGIWGFHGDHRPHGDRLLQLGRHVPAVTIVIDTPNPKIGELAGARQRTLALGDAGLCGLGWSGGGFEGDAVAEGFELPDV